MPSGMSSTSDGSHACNCDSNECTSSRSPAAADDKFQLKIRGRIDELLNHIHIQTLPIVRQGKSSSLALVRC